MKFIPNNWSAIRAHYAYHSPRILAAPKNEWAGDAYDWDDGQGIIYMTPIEAWLWGDIRAYDLVLYPQYPVGRFFVDFANPVAKVAIECDGAAYHQDKAKDAVRDRELLDLNWTVYRITGSDCRTECDEETGEPGNAGRFIRAIGDSHGIRRDGDTDGDWVHGGDLAVQEVARLLAWRAEQRGGSL